MSVEIAVAVTLVLLFVLLIIRTPVAFALAGAGVVGTILVRGWDVARTSVATVPFQATARHALVIIPLFILMGILAKHCRIVEDVFRLAARYLRWLPGGLGVSTVAACAAFAAVSGSSIATAAAVGRIAFNEMRKFGYKASFAAGIVASAGTLGVLIPPSLMLVVYGILTGESIGRLLIGGIIPGFLSAGLYAAWIMLRSRRGVAPVDTARSPRPKVSNPHPEAGPATARVVLQDTAEAGGAGIPEDGLEPLREQPSGRFHAADGQDPRGSGVMGLVRALVLFVIVIGGIYAGVFTATESAAVGACAALVMLVLFFRRSTKALWSSLRASLQEAASLSSMIFAILIGASFFTFFLVSAGVPTSFARWATELPVDRAFVVVILLLCMIPLGMFLDGVSVLVLATPFLYPVATALGFDGIWFGVLSVKMVELALITPPVGLNVYVVASVAEVSVEDAFRGVMGFAFVDLITVCVLVLFPGLVLWLPMVMRGG